MKINIITKMMKNNIINKLWIKKIKNLINFQ